ncbi:UDP-N-acetylmuramate dehydrogenase [Pistricoccus aurantiacus]|uniref:UDP-N-acetylmuramate dehydrogenase n=1 Tax=Pistricoccus aurantiacus TaxID=1883414 RepID=UPI001FE4F64A|nr:UDP-N-acetylmuramate dehydrogenase [Pistricoccus aurantiacus]
MAVEWQERVDLTRANTLGLPCIAERFIGASTSQILKEATALARQRDWPLTLLGGGSNLILGPWLPGLVITPTFDELCLSPLDDQRVRVDVDAGMNWHVLVMRLANEGLWGIENLALIPGQCGAAPIQNIGAYGVELAEVLKAVRIIHLDSGRQDVLNASDCAFGYRDSIFKNALMDKVAITGLTLEVTRKPRPRLTYGDLARRVSVDPTPLEVAEAVCAVRREKLPDPQALSNAGSFFKNPLINWRQARRLLEDYPEMPHFPQPDGRVKLAAGWLIEQCGLKGWQKGCFGVHEKQALVLVHHGGGSAQELLDFAGRVAARVEARFGVILEWEPRTRYLSL